MKRYTVHFCGRKDGAIGRWYMITIQAELASTDNEALIKAIHAAGYNTIGSVWFEEA